MAAEDLVQLTRAAAVRGRGGAGFPFSRKLSAAREAGKRRVVVVNAAEGEPGSAKDSALLLTVPHLVLDGAAIVARALHVATVHVVVPGERPAVLPAVEQAIAESDTGIEFTVQETSGGFVGGQARAVLELLAGRENLPVTAWAPEAVDGLRGRPTLLSNAETYAQLAVLCALGPVEYGRFGTADEPGTTLVTVGGDGVGGMVLEVPFGARLSDVLTHCGHDVGAPVVLGGYHGVWLTPREVAVRQLSRADLAASGATLGAGVILPVPRDACPVLLTSQVVTYLAGQSARRCGPCLNGLPALAEACAALAGGYAGETTFGRIELLVGQLPGRGACAHPDGTVRLVRSLLRAFPDEVAAHLAGPCRTPIEAAAS
jgi:NADH:ubiquinone oxidoreductase subunit F (NADH-binding)